MCGNDVGTFETTVPDWSVGMEFYNRDHVEFRILDIVHQLGDGEFNGAFVDTPVELAEP